MNGEIIINIADDGNITVRINSSTYTDSLETIYSDSGRIHGTSITTGLTIEGSLSEGKGTYKARSLGRDLVSKKKKNKIQIQSKYNL